MAFTMKSSPKDEKLFHKFGNNEENVLTFGRGSYGPAEITFYHETLANVLVGRFSSIAFGVMFLIGGNHPLKNVVSTSPLDIASVVKDIFGEARPNLPPLPNVRRNSRQIIIGHDVWLGRNAMILGGVKIGNGAVIGANAVVAKDIPPYAIAVGNPARVIKYRFDEETIKKFLAVKWWNWSLEKIADNFPLMNDAEKFLAEHYSPELEKFPEDDSSRLLQSLRGVSIYHFITDFRATNPLWRKVINEFAEANLAKSLLVVWFAEDSTAEDKTSLTEAIGTNENIITFDYDKNTTPAVLRLGTHFITTREMTTLEALDYLWNTDVKIISALDNDIFGG